MYAIRVNIKFESLTAELTIISGVFTELGFKISNS